MLLPVLQSAPITLRGTLFTLASMYLLISSVATHSDVVAAVLATTCLSLISLSLAMCTFLRLQFRKSLEWQILVENFERAHASPTSDEPVAVVIRTPRLLLLPLVNCSIRLGFSEDGLVGTLHRISASLWRKSYLLNDKITFPHRGIWHPTHLELTLGDQFGLIMFSWTVFIAHSTSSVEVAPPTKQPNRFPFISAASRPGDTLPDNNHQQGDYYDFRAYQEGDGLNKVLWKLYARSGELYTRQPERSVSPEGTVAVFALAARDTDLAASTAISYVNHLTENEIDVYFGCEGSKEGAPARTVRAATEILISSVWNIPKQWPVSPDTLAIYLAQLTQLHPNADFHSIVLIGHDYELSQPGALRYYEQCGICAEQMGITPLFFIGSSQVVARSHLSQFFMPSWPARLILHSEDSTPQNPQAASQFSKICDSHSWQLIEPTLSGVGSIGLAEPVEQKLREYIRS